MSESGSGSVVSGTRKKESRAFVNSEVVVWLVQIDTMNMGCDGGIHLAQSACLKYNINVVAIIAIERVATMAMIDGCIVDEGCGGAAGDDECGDGGDGGRGRGGSKGRGGGGGGGGDRGGEEGGCKGEGEGSG